MGCDRGSDGRRAERARGLDRAAATRGLLVGGATVCPSRCGLTFDGTGNSGGGVAGDDLDVELEHLVADLRARRCRHEVERDRYGRHRRPHRKLGCGAPAGRERGSGERTPSQNRAAEVVEPVIEAETSCHAAAPTSSSTRPPSAPACSGSSSESQRTPSGLAGTAWAGPGTSGVSLGRCPIRSRSRAAWQVDARQVHALCRARCRALASATRSSRSPRRRALCRGDAPTGAGTASCRCSSRTS